EDKLKVITLVAEYNKVLADVKVAAQTTGVAYDHCMDQDKVTSMLLANDEAELKDFREKNKGNRVEQEKILAKVERKYEAIEILRVSIKTRLKELYTVIMRKMDALEDQAKELETA
ncbi:hypothetical protein KI387_007198, partial [Taxus chinensis]